MIQKEIINSIILKLNFELQISNLAMKLLIEKSRIPMLQVRKLLMQFWICI